MQIPPSQKVPLLIQGPQDFLMRVQPYLLSLGKLSEIQIDATGQLIDAKSAQAPVVIVDEIRLLLEIKIDVEVEKLRISKEMVRLETEINKCYGKLSNESFVSKAPPEVLSQEKNRMADFKSKLARLSEQWEKLSLK
jgi:valyl-tRNA synthetase